MAEFLHRIVTPSSVQLISLSDAKMHLRVDWDDDDQSIGRMLWSVKAAIETHLNRFLIDTEIMQPFPGWSRVVFLPFAPVLSVESVKYYDTSNVLQTIPSTDYEWENAGVSPVICEATGKTWPSLFDRISPVEITLKCGYGTSVTDVPMDIIDAAYLLLADRYECQVGDVEENKTVMALLAKYRNLT